MAFQRPPTRRVRIEYDIDVSAGDPISPSSPPSSSSVQFSVTFAVRDYDTLCYGGPNPSPRLTDDPTPAIRSPTVVLSPPIDRPGCWDPVEAALAGLGLELGARDEVIGALRARLSVLVDDEKVMASSSSSSSSRRLRIDVNIKRLISSIFYNPMYLIGQYRRSSDGASSARRRANKALEALERVTSSEESLLPDECCAICLEELKCVVGGADEEREREGVLMRLPCRHKFHGGCLLKWFKKSLRCPLCRSPITSASASSSTSSTSSS